MLIITTTTTASNKIVTTIDRWTMLIGSIIVNSDTSYDYDCKKH